MKRVITALLVLSLMLCGCGGKTEQEITAVPSENVAVSENNQTVKEEETVSEAQVVEEVREPVTITYTVSEDEIYEEFTFSRIPTDVKDLEIIDAKFYDDPYATAALAIITMCNYENDPDETIRMLEYLNGTEGLTDYEKSFHRAELDERAYKAFSYLKGATPDNYYTPDTPYVIRITGDKFTWVLDGRVKVFAATSGSDKPRAINVRYDDAVKRWCVYEHGLLGYMRAPGPEVQEELYDESLDTVSENEVLDEAQTEAQTEIQAETQQQITETQTVNEQQTDVNTDTISQ